MSLKRCTFPCLGTLAVLSACACVEDEREAPKRPVRVVVRAVSTAPIECHFDPVSLAGEPSKSGLDMCYTPADTDPWWAQYRAPAGEAPRPELADASAAADTACPPEMVLVEGMYCPDVRQKCLHYLDDAQPGAFLAHTRCGEFDKHPECAGGREHRRFCIDRDEYVASGSELPLVEQSWTTTGELCESLGKRLCFESEWQFACEGEDLLPYPYGFVRNAKLCNHDLPELEDKNTGKLYDKRVRPADRPKCLSPFGARNMVGNVDEWTYRDAFVKPYRAALHGGWWLAGRNNCRAATTGHDEYYFGPQTGVRCCKNAR